MVGDGVVHVHSALMLYATPACLLLALLFRPLWLLGRAEQHGLRMDAAEGRRFSQRPEVQRTHAACAKGLHRALPRGGQSAMKVVISFLQCVSQFPEETSVAAPPHSALLVHY